MKKVEARALNLTSKLLIKEMDLGLLKKEKIRLEQKVKQKDTEKNSASKVLLGENEKKINLGSLIGLEVKKQATTLMPVNNSVEKKISAENSDVKEQIVDKLKDIKKKQHELETDKEKIIEKAEKVEKDTDKEEIVDKLVDIKKKQAALEEAKKDFFSDTVGDASEKSENKVNTDNSKNTISESESPAKNNSNSESESQREGAPLTVDQDDIRSLIKLPDASNLTAVDQLVSSASPGVTPASPTIPLLVIPTTPNNYSPLTPADPLTNGSIVVNAVTGINNTVDISGSEQEKKIHIILDVNNKDGVLNNKDGVLNNRDDVLNNKDDVLNNKDDVLNNNDDVLNNKQQ